MKYQKTRIIAGILLGLLIAIFGSAQAAEPIFGTITLDPAEPTALDTITFSVEINGTNISWDSESVHIIVEECNGNTGICYPLHNITMTNVQGMLFEGDVPLTHDDATYITYYVNVKHDDQWTNTTAIKLTLAEPLPPDDNTTNGNGNNGSPGFEMVFVIVALAVSIILIGRKRSR